MPDLKDALLERFKMNSSDTGRYFSSKKGVERARRKDIGGRWFAKKKTCMGNFHEVH